MANHILLQRKTRLAMQEKKILVVLFILCACSSVLVVGVEIFS